MFILSQDKKALKDIKEFYIKLHTIYNNNITGMYNKNVKTNKFGISDNNDLYADNRLPGRDFFSRHIVQRIMHKKYCNIFI